MIKSSSFIIFLTIIIIASIVVSYNSLNKQQSASIAEALPQSVSAETIKSDNISSAQEDATSTDEIFRDNFKDMQEFKKSIPIVWMAKLDGCLMSCYGAAFTRVASNVKYPRFSGYYPDASGKYNWETADNGDMGGNQIPDKFLKENLLLKIYGKWIMIDDDHSRTVFDNKCVPVIEIEKIEIVK